MKIRTLNNKTLNWQPKGDSPVYDIKARSGLHSKAKALLKEEYPTYSLLQEVSIPVEDRKTLHLDFYLPLSRTAIEVQGEQHFKYTPFFHGSVQGFVLSKKNDSKKAEWCELNNIRLIYFNYDEDLDEWRSKLSG